MWLENDFYELHRDSRPKSIFIEYFYELHTIITKRASSFARTCIEVQDYKELPKSLAVDYGRPTQVKLKLSWKPQACSFK